MTDDQILMQIVGEQHRINILRSEIKTENDISVVKSKVEDMVETFDRMQQLEFELRSRQLDRLQEEIESK